MIRLNKIGLSALAVFALVSCNATENPGDVKNFLLSNGFICRIPHHRTLG